MKYLICYDISDPKRLHEISSYLNKKGYRVQKSIFTCNLEYDEYMTLKNDLIKVIDINSDRLAIYKVCENCAKSGFYLGCDIDSFFKEDYLVL